MKKASDFDEIWYTNADVKLNDSHVAKNENFQNSRWRTAVILMRESKFSRRPGYSRWGIIFGRLSLLLWLCYDICPKNLLRLSSQNFHKRPAIAARPCHRPPPPNLQSEKKYGRLGKTRLIFGLAGLSRKLKIWLRFRWIQIFCV